jgi:hypothetical protein
MQAPKNGFSMCSIARPAMFMSGTPYVNVTWPAGSIPRRTANREAGSAVEHDRQAAAGAARPDRRHNWQPMSYSPIPSLYLPAIEGAFFYMARDPPRSSAARRLLEHRLNTASSTLPDDEAVRKAIRASAKDPGDRERFSSSRQRYRQVRGV